MVYRADAVTGAKAEHGAFAVSSDAARAQGDARWPIVRQQLTARDTASGGAPGTFSFVDWGAGSGGLAMEVATTFPQATVVRVRVLGARLCGERVRG